MRVERIPGPPFRGGTIIDIECECLRPGYRPNLKSIFCYGFLSGSYLVQLYAEDPRGVPALRRLIDSMKYDHVRPLYAYSKGFEEKWLNISINYDLMIHDEIGLWLAKRRFIPPSKYGDPFMGDGFRCVEAWKNGDISDILIHNASCLKSERDICEYMRGRGVIGVDPGFGVPAVEVV